MFADLHIHTDYSDGIHSPESIIKKSLKVMFQSKFDYVDDF